MSSRKTRPESSRVVFTTGLTRHLKPQLPGPEARETRRSPGGRKSPPSRADLGKQVERESARTQAERPIKPEPMPGWVTRSEALALLELDEATLGHLLKAYKLSRTWVEIYSKAEILALRNIVKALR